MNAPAPRPTNWTFILGSVAGAVVLGFLFLRGFLFPFQQANKNLATLENEYDEQRREYLAFLRDKKRLEGYRLLGLPRNLEQGGSDYARYFQKLLRDCQLTVEDFQGPSGIDSRPQAAAASKKAGHVVLSFMVRARGDWRSLVKLLEKFQRTPLLHRLRTMSIDEQKSSEKASLGRLVMTLGIETLVVNRNDQRPDNLFGVDSKLVALDCFLGLEGQPAGWAMLLRGQALLLPEMPRRRYAELAWLDPFVGYQPPGAPVFVAKSKPPKSLPRDARPDMSLVLTNHSAQKAILLAANKPAQEASINLAPPPGQDTFQVWDGKSLVKGKVLRVDHRDLYVKVDKEVYGIHIGQTLAEAMERPLSPKEVKNLGLPDKINQVKFSGSCPEFLDCPGDTSGKEK